MADEPTLRETLESAYDEAVQLPDEDAAQAPQPEAVETSDASSSEDSRPRDESGKFVAADTPESSDAPIEPDPLEAPAEVEAPATETSEAAAEPPAHGAPASWTAAAQSEWESLPPAIQAEVLKREMDINRGLQQSAERLKSYDGVEQALAPVQQIFQQGVSPAQYIQQLVQWDVAFKNDPQGTLKALAQQYGADPSALAEPEFDDGFTDPAITALKQQVNSLQQMEEQRLAQIQQQQLTSAQQQIDQFKATHPHYDAVEIDMMGYLNSARQAGLPDPSLDEMYDRAVWANPQVRAIIQTEQRAAADAARKAEQEKRAAEARRSAEVNLSSEGVSEGETPAPTSIRATLEQEYDRLQEAN